MGKLLDFLPLPLGRAGPWPEFVLPMSPYAHFCVTLVILRSTGVPCTDIFNLVKCIYCSPLLLHFYCFHSHLHVLITVLATNKIRSSNDKNRTISSHASVIHACICHHHRITTDFTYNGRSRRSYKRSITRNFIVF